MEKLSKNEIHKELEKLQRWEYRENAIHANYEFKDFKEVFSVMVRIAFEAEAKQHHPEWSNVYNKLSISLSTHDAGGVTAKDFELAKAIGAIISKG